MSRFLFVVPPFVERLRPAQLISWELSIRGHQVTWARSEDLCPKGTTGLLSPAGQLVLWDDVLLPLARRMLPVVRTTVARFEPDALVVDECALAGAAVAHLSGKPWATLVPRSADLTDPLWDLPEIARHVRRRTQQFLVEAGLDCADAGRLDPRRSPHLVVAFSTEELAGAVDDRGERYAFVGPTPRPIAPDVAFNWGWLDRARPLVIASLETPWRQAAPLYRVVADALSSLDVQGVIVAPPDLVRHAPANVVVVPRAPLQALARRAAALVCDGGHDTVCEALVNGIPVVVSPMIAEQPLVAEQVVRAGAGVRVAARSLDPMGLRGALSSALTDPIIRGTALRIRDSFATAGGPFAAADHLERLVNTTATAKRRC